MADEELEQDNTPPAPAPKRGSNRPVIKKRVKRKEREEELEEPDEFVEVGGSVVDWVMERSGIIGGILVASLVLILVYGIWTQVQAGRLEKASQAYFLAQRELPAPAGGGLFMLSGDDGPSKEEVDKAVAAFDGVIDDYGGTAAGKRAALSAADALYQDGRYEESLKYFELASKGRGLVAEMASRGRAYAYESLQRWDDAVAAFEAVREAARGEAKEQALIDLARVHAAKGDSAKAAELYAQFEEEYPESLMLPQVQASAAALGQ